MAAQGDPEKGTDAEAELRLRSGETVHLFGEAADASVVGSIAVRGVYESGLLQALSAMVAPDWVCLDIGANIGPISLALSRLCPAGEVHAFEPVAESFEYLARNALANDAANLKLHRLALLDHAGEVVINYNLEASGAAFISDHLVDGVQQGVAATTLDRWVAQEGLRRVDLVKIDVEGSEELVLDGGTATIARFRPILVVELNPITIRRMQQRDPRQLYTRLRSLYGRAGHLAAVPEDGPLVPVVSWSHVERLIAEFGLCNLVCSPSRLVPGVSRGVAAPTLAVRSIAASFLRMNRFRTPPWAAIHEPRVTIRPAAGFAAGRSLRGSPGKQIVVPMSVTNRGKLPIVGRAPQFAVSVRVVWIDAEGHHEVDDRSRTTVPTIRPGSTSRVQVPIHLPEEPGMYVLRITLFQDYVAWFYDLDSSNCSELSVEVVAERGG